MELLLNCGIAQSGLELCIVVMKTRLILKRLKS